MGLSRIEVWTRYIRRDIRIAAGRIDARWDRKIRLVGQVLQEIRVHRISAVALKVDGVDHYRVFASGVRKPAIGPGRRILADLDGFVYRGVHAGDTDRIRQIDTVISRERARRELVAWRGAADLGIGAEGRVARPQPRKVLGSAIARSNRRAGRRGVRVNLFDNAVPGGGAPWRGRAVPEAVRGGNIGEVHLHGALVVEVVVAPAGAPGGDG